MAELNPDDYPTVVQATAQHVCKANAAVVRRLAVLSRDYPGLTPEQALMDAADMIEKAASSFTAVTRQ